MCLVLAFAVGAAAAQPSPDTPTQPPAQPQPPTEAPPPPPPTPLTPEEEAAKKHFENANALFNEKNYAAALAEYEESYRLNPYAGVLFNIAITQKRMFRYADAVDTLEKLLASGASLAPEQAAVAKESLEEMKALLADVTLDVQPAGAAIAIDGRAMKPTAGKPVRMSVGNHVVEVTLDGYTTVKKDVTVTAGVAQTVAVKLVAIPKTGKVHITTTAPHSTIAIDGKPMGSSPLDVELLGGGHSLEVSAPSYHERREELVIAAGQSREVAVVLDRVVVAKPWYKKWGVVGPLAVIVIGGSVGVYLGLESRPDPISGTLGVGKIP